MTDRTFETFRNGAIKFMALNSPFASKADRENGVKPKYSITIEVEDNAENQQKISTLRTATSNNNLFTGKPSADGLIKIVATNSFAPVVTDGTGSLLSITDEHSGQVLSNENVPRGGRGVTGTADIQVSTYVVNGKTGRGINLQGVALKSIEVDEDLQTHTNATDITVAELLKGLK